VVPACLPHGLARLTGARDRPRGEDVKFLDIAGWKPVRHGVRDLPAKDEMETGDGPKSS